MKKKILTLSAILIIAICSMFFCISASAEVYEGTCGAAATWSLDTETETLTISGSGAMYDYDDGYDDYPGSVEDLPEAPWLDPFIYDYDTFNQLTVIISEGISHIGSCSFYVGMYTGWLPRIKDIYFPSTLKSMGYDAFLLAQNSDVNLHIPSIDFWFDLDWDNSFTNGEPEYQYNLVLNENHLTEITVPYSVTNIRDYAFTNIAGITKVTLSYSVESIGEYAFDRCKNLYSINIPDSVTSIGDYAFRGCTGLSSLTIPDSVTSIGNCAFGGCTGFTSVSIPDSVTNIGIALFSGCSNLTDISVSDNNEYYCDIDGVLYDKNKTTLICCPGGKDDVKLIIPEGVTLIKKSAFSGCAKLTGISLPNSLQTIEDRAFLECKNLTELYISDLEVWMNLDWGIVAKPFYSSAGGNLYLNDELVTELIIPEGTAKISSETFYKIKSITKVIIPDSVVDLSLFAFSGCDNLKNVYISDIRMLCYADPWGASVNPRFNNADLYLNNTLATDIVIPDDVTVIESYAFSGFGNIKSVVIPASVTSIGSSAFYKCSNIEAFYVTKGSYAESWLKSEGYGSLISYGLAVEEDNIKITVGESVTLTSSIVESVIDMDSVIWSSDNEDVATVENGVITAKSVGTAIITLSANNGTVSDSCTVTIIPSLPTTADEFLTFEGYQLRENKYNGLRSRFVVNLANMPKISTHGYTVIEYGTVIASSDLLDKNGDELTVSKNAEGDYATLSYATLCAIRKNGSYVGKYESKDANELVYFCTVTKFNEKTYDLKVEIRGYAVIIDSEGNEYVIYADYPDEEYRSVSLKQMCLEMASEGLIDTTTCISYLHVVQFMEESGKYGDNEVDGDEFFEEY